MSDWRINILVDNCASRPWQSEHGLSLSIARGAERILFDTGAGAALPHNLPLSGLDVHDFTKVVLSHGHNDHTGGVAWFLSMNSQATVYHGPGVFRRRFSLHPGHAPHDLQMPSACREALKAHGSVTVDRFLEVGQGAYLTGPIPRLSGEDCGGPFFLSDSGGEPDLLDDEIGLLLDSGTLIQGCCHSGIINSIEACRSARPEVRIRRVVGGLHLVHASEERLVRTAQYLEGLALEELVLLHCTGAEAMEYLQSHLSCRVVIGQAGEVYDG